MADKIEANVKGSGTRAVSVQTDRYGVETPQVQKLLALELAVMSTHFGWLADNSHGDKKFDCASDSILFRAERFLKFLGSK